MFDSVKQTALLLWALIQSLCSYLCHAAVGRSTILNAVFLYKLTNQSPNIFYLRSEAFAVCPRQEWTYQTADECLYGVVSNPSKCPPQNLPWRWHDRLQCSTGLWVVQSECRAEEALLWSGWPTERHAQTTISWYERQRQQLLATKR